MKTISIMLDDDMFQTIERTANTLHVSVTAFMQSALRLAVQQQDWCELEQQHRQGYLTKPIDVDEFSVWEEEQAWGDRSTGVKSVGITLKPRIKNDRS